MTFNAASNRWEYTATTVLFATQLDCVFNNGSATWDNNGGQDWHFAVQSNTVPPVPQPPPTPTGLTASPVGTNQINLTWTASTNATGYIVQRAGSNVATIATTSFSDIGLATATAYCYAITATNSVGNSTPTVSQCATTLAPVTNLPAFNMDGVLDSTNFLVASSGMTIYAALRGPRLYVATWTPGTNGLNDHFIFVSDALLTSASANAPWAKSGMSAIATSKPFLGGESVGTYVAWQNAPAGSQAVKASTDGGAMEGTIDLVAAFGAMPTNIYLCSAAYQTADGGVLGGQCPAGTGPDIDTNEVFVIPTIALRDQNGDGKFDRLDPAMDFKILSTRATNNGVVLTWASFPGRAYQSESVGEVGGAWSNASGGALTAGVLQAEMQAATSVNTNTPRTFWRVRLLP